MFPISRGQRARLRLHSEIVAVASILKAQALVPASVGYLYAPAIAKVIVPEVKNGLVVIGVRPTLEPEGDCPSVAGAGAVP